MSRCCEKKSQNIIINNLTLCCDFHKQFSVPNRTSFRSYEFRYFILLSIGFSSGAYDFNVFGSRTGTVRFLTPLRALVYFLYVPIRLRGKWPYVSAPVFSPSLATSVPHLFHSDYRVLYFRIKCPLSSTEWLWTDYIRIVERKKETYRLSNGRPDRFSCFCAANDPRRWTRVYTAIRTDQDRLTESEKIKSK